MTMHQDVQFAASLDGWATVPAAALEAVEVWNAAAGLVVDSPIAGLRADAYAGRLTAKNVTERLTEAGQIIAAQVVAPQLRDELDGPLSQRFADAILVAADDIVAELALHFDKYAAMIPEYAPLVRPGVTAEDLLSTSSGDVVTAWQTLSVIEGTLEQVAAFRMQLSTRYGYPMPTPGVACWIGPVNSADDLARASLTWRGHRSVGDPDSGVTVPLDEVRGGRWRHLFEAGFTLACNTADQAAAVAAPLAPAPVAA